MIVAWALLGPRLPANLFGILPMTRRGFALLALVLVVFGELETSRSLAQLVFLLGGLPVAWLFVRSMRRGAAEASARSAAAGIPSAGAASRSSKTGAAASTEGNREVPDLEERRKASRMRVMRPNVSPLDIRKRTFPIRFRGLDRNEVTQYLDLVADDLEELMRTLDELERENARLKDEVARHRESEASLKETLLMAQRNAETLRSDTEREADRILVEANRHADRIVQQALEKSAEKEKRIRELRMERKNFHLKLQGMLDMFQQVLNFDKEEEDLDHSVSVMRPEAKGRGGRLSRLVVRHLSQLATPLGSAARTGADQGRISRVEDAALVVEDGLVAVDRDRRRLRPRERRGAARGRRRPRRPREDGPPRLRRPAHAHPLGGLPRGRVQRAAEGEDLRRDRRRRRRDRLHGLGDAERLRRGADARHAPAPRADAPPRDDVLRGEDRLRSRPRRPRRSSSRPSSPRPTATPSASRRRPSRGTRCRSSGAARRR